MLGIVAAVLFLIALIFMLANIVLGVFTWQALTVAGLLFVALDLAGVGSRSRMSSRR